MKANKVTSYLARTKAEAIEDHHIRGVYRSQPGAETGVVFLAAAGGEADGSICVGRVGYGGDGGSPHWENSSGCSSSEDFGDHSHLLGRGEVVASRQRH